MGVVEQVMDTANYELVITENVKLGKYREHFGARTIEELWDILGSSFQ